MAPLIRSLVYATVFIGVLLIWVPRSLLEWSGALTPPDVSVAQIAGLMLSAAGGCLIAWCVGSFAFIGRGTPAPFDAPRRLVIRGPYRFVRNPMYIGAVLVLIGAASFYESAVLLGYAVFFLLAVHLFVRFYEEPTLRRSFGQAYDRYCVEVRRWLPRRPWSVSSRGEDPIR